MSHPFPGEKNEFERDTIFLGIKTLVSLPTVDGILYQNDTVNCLL